MVAAIPVWGQFVDLLRLVLSVLIGLTGSPSVAIVLFTLGVRLLLVPLALQAHRSGRALQALQPQLKALQRRHRNDQQQLAAATQRLYREHRINPVAGCLPALIQAPIGFGLYQSILGVSTQGGEALGAGFLWLPSLAQTDPWYLLPLLAAFFQLLQARMALPAGRRRVADPQERTLRQVTQILPLAALAFGSVAASGLALYWATQAAFGAAQQYFLTGWGALRDWLPFLPQTVRDLPPAA